MMTPSSDTEGVYSCTNLLIGGLHGGNEAGVEPGQPDHSKEANRGDCTLQNGATESRMTTLHGIH